METTPDFESILPGYPVKLENFEGPLDLLLHLIKKNELSVYDIPIVLITDQYLAYLDLMKELNLDVAGEFLVMAATLNPHQVSDARAETRNRGSGRRTGRPGVTR